MTNNQLKALADLRDGKWRYGISIRGRHALPSLHKRGLVFKYYRYHYATQWQITPEGEAVFVKYATLLHLRKD